MTARRELPRMISIREAQELTGLSEHLLRQLCRLDKVITLQINSKYYIQHDSLCEYLSQTNKIKCGG